MSARADAPLALLVVAGRDSSGGAGVDADRDAASELGASARCAVTADTVQDERGLRELGAREPEAWLAEARALAGEGVAALKLGLLPGAAHVAAAARLAGELRARWGAGFPIVLDPVLAASSGARFLDAAGVDELLLRMAELAPVLTPNLPEAAELCGLAAAELATDLAARERAARALVERGARAVLLKGGHGREEPVRDLVWEPGRGARWIEHPRLAGAIRGSGCRYATAVAVGLASGRELPEAARAAARLVAARIAARS